MAHRRTWRNTTALVAVAALGLGACGGGDDDTDAVPAAEGSADEPADEPADETAEEPADDTSTRDDATGDDSDASDDMSDSSDDGSSGDGRTIRSIDDVPSECRDELAEFLRDIEPIVDGTDWETATLADVEAVGAEFQERSDEFDRASRAAGCDDLDFEDDNSFDLIVEFAKDEAPGTVGFLSFLNDFTTAMAETMEDTLGVDGSSDAGSDREIDDCESGIAYVEQLMADYENLTEAPLGEIAKLGDVAFAMMDCTPEQAEFFDRDDVAAFLDG